MSEYLELPKPCPYCGETKHRLRGYLQINDKKHPVTNCYPKIVLDEEAVKASMGDE